jgi:hypothetical protein
LLQNTDESNKQTSEASALVRMRKAKKQKHQALMFLKGFGLDNSEEDVAKQPSKKDPSK